MYIEIVGKFFDYHSLSIVNRHLALELAKYTDVSILPLDKDEYNKFPEISALRQTKDKVVDIQIRHSYPPVFLKPLDERTKVVYIQPWEFNRAPLEWQLRFEQADLLIVPSNWTANVFLNGGMDPRKVKVIPNGVSKFGNRTQNKNKFLFVGSGVYRKGLDILLQAWSKIPFNSDYELTIKDTSNIYGDYHILEKILHLQYHTNCAKITYNDERLDSLIPLYEDHKYIVSPYRGEGYNMPVAEAMAVGCIPLVTRGGPTDDFVKDEECFINSTLKIHDLTAPPVSAVKPGDSLTLMGSHGTLLEPNQEHLLQLLINPPNIQVDTSDIYSWEIIGQQYFHTLTNI